MKSSKNRLPFVQFKKIRIVYHHSKSNEPARVMLWGVGAFTQAVLQILKQQGAEVCTYLTRDYGHYGPALEGETFLPDVYPEPCTLLNEREIDLVIPMSIDWILTDWVDDFLSTEIPIFSPTGQGMLLERDRDFTRRLCEKYRVPFPEAFLAKNRLEAENILNEHQKAFVIKNTLCSPSSPVHTIICESAADTRSWLKRINYEEGVFLQEYMGTREAGHIALVSGGEIYSLITNQEYKRAFNGNMGMVAGAPLGGLVEQDPQDKYGLAEQLLHPLRPWFREVHFHGPVQVTAVRKNDRWFVLEYNVRIGVTCGPIILRMLKEPLQVLLAVAKDEKPTLQFHEDLKYGCSLTLAGFGYPYEQIRGPELPVQIHSDFDCDVWWNEVAQKASGELYSTGQRIADVVAIESTLNAAIEKAYKNIAKIRCLSSYYRTDVGQSLWPPGSE
ncbi:MAG: phosphoribosylglycinamide synthetase C domain-containing protein [bacterium]